MIKVLICRTMTLKPKVHRFNSVKAAHKYMLKFDDILFSQFLQ